MTRRTLMALASGRLLDAQLSSGIRYRNYARCLPEYIAALAAEARGRREQAMAGLTSRAAIEARQAWARDTFWRLTGGKPEKTPRNPIKLGGFDRPGYHLERMVYESQPGVLVPANLYVPSTGKPPYPGVLFQMGHAGAGKAAPLYQKCCQGLAQLGYVVLAFDPMGQGERLYYPSSLGPTEQHTAAGRELMLAGDTATRLQVWDAVRSLDVLAEHSKVDPSRLASTGQSGGGMLTQMLACVDQRLAAAAVSCGNTENYFCAEFNPPGSTDDAEQNFIDSGRAGFDRWDLLYPLAPKPLLVMVSARDWIGTYSPNYLTDGRAEYQRLAAVYRTFGYPDRIEWKETPLAHALTYALRLGIYNWFERWLKKSGRVIAEEPAVSPEPEDMLRCGVAIPKPEFRRRRGIRHTLAEKARTNGSATVLGRVPTSDGMDVEAIEVASEAGVYLPVWRYVPRKAPADARVLLVLEARGRNAHAEENGLYHQLAQGGVTVWAADVRGVGDLTPEFSRGAAGYARSHNDEDDWAWASLILGRPLVAQRVADILALVAATRGPVVVAAIGKMTVPALYAAAADARISALYLAGGTPSLGDPGQALANLLPGGVPDLDLRRVAESIAPRRVHTTGESAWTLEEIRAFVLS